MASLVHELLPLNQCEITSEQNFMKLKITHKEISATTAGDINSPNLLVLSNFAHVQLSYSLVTCNKLVLRC